jgi:integrase
MTEIGLGSVDAVTLAQAREQAGRIERKREQVEAESRKTFEDVARYVIDRDKGRWVPDWTQAWETSLFEHAAILGPINIDEITVAHVKQVVSPIWERGAHVIAHRTLKRVEAVLSCAIAHGWRSGANVASWDVFKHISPKRPNGDGDRHHPMLPWQEAPAAIAKLREIDSMSARAVEFTMLTGMRISEAAGTTWDEIDFEGAVWSIPKGRMKMRQPHVVPLSSQAIELLTALQGHSAGPIVFYGRANHKPVSTLQCWRQSVLVTDGKGSTHGWRSTFRSWCAANGVVREVAESALAHTVPGVEGADQRDQMVERRRPVMQAWGDYLAGEAGTAAVVPFKGKQA